MSLSPSGLVKSEPVLVAHFTAWLLLQGGLIVVGRYHLIGGSSWSALSSALAPAVTAVFLGVVAWLVRRVVTPASKLIEHDAPGVATAISTVVDDALAAAQAAYPMPAPPQSVPAPTPAAPTA